MQKRKGDLLPVFFTKRAIAKLISFYFPTNFTNYCYIGLVLSIKQINSISLKTNGKINNYHVRIKN